MDLKHIKTLIDLMTKNELSVLKIEEEGFKISLKKGAENQPIMTMAAPASYAPLPLQAAAAAAPAAAPAESGGKEIVSPMVGTFYNSASPDSPPFVSVGQEVQEDTVVCIIEAMKVMNEIKAEMRGTITEVLAEGGKAVQFGQAMFRLK